MITHISAVPVRDWVISVPIRNKNSSVNRKAQFLSPMANAPEMQIASENTSGLSVVPIHRSNRSGLNQ